MIEDAEAHRLQIPCQAVGRCPGQLGVLTQFDKGPHRPPHIETAENLQPSQSPYGKGVVGTSGTARLSPFPSQHMPIVRLIKHPNRHFDYGLTYGRLTPIIGRAIIAIVSECDVRYHIITY